MLMAAAIRATVGAAIQRFASKIASVEMLYLKKKIGAVEHPKKHTESDEQTYATTPVEISNAIRRC